MIYKEFQGLKLSALGMGTMRLPVIDGEDAKIDVKAAEEMVAYAMEKGINYYDTAWGYHGGQSEVVMGKILSKYPREKYYLATKFPGYDLSNMDKVESIFEKQLEKCGVDYFDFYLLHNVWETNIDAYLDEKYGILEYLLKQKELGRIRHLGFSLHGSCKVLRRLLEAYGEQLEFGQLQLNYLDWTFQNAKEKLEILEEYKIPAWVMEPVRGGKLAELSKEDTDKLRELRPDEGTPAWAFRFLQTLPGVTMVLSGMSNYEQMKENIHTYEENKPLNDKELKVLLDIAAGMLNHTLPCTACKYCMNYCPQGLEIPTLLSLYNEHCFTEGGFIAPMIVAGLPKEKRPSACVGCRSCEAVCPQQIKISEAMSDFTQRLS